MTNPLGVDWLGSGPTAAELAAAGKVFRLGYIDRPDSSLTRIQIDLMHAAGIDIGLIAEWGAQRMLGGASAGVMDGMRIRDALTQLGAPSGTVVYCAADWNATAAQMAKIDGYLGGVASVIGHECTGVYGGRAVILHVLASGSASHFWQTYAWCRHAAALGHPGHPPPAVLEPPEDRRQDGGPRRGHRARVGPVARRTSRQLRQERT